MIQRKEVWKVDFKRKSNQNLRNSNIDFVSGTNHLSFDHNPISMKYLSILFTLIILSVCIKESEPSEQMEIDKSQLKIRIAELEIDSAYLEDYLRILKQESAASVKLEPGVICIFPTFIEEQPNQIRLLEVYANQEAYESHIQSPHFQEYKTSTLHMVQSLKLIDVEAVDLENMPEVFKKL